MVDPHGSRFEALSVAPWGGVYRVHLIPGLRARTAACQSRYGDRLSSAVMIGRLIKARVERRLPQLTRLGIRHRGGAGEKERHGDRPGTTAGTLLDARRPGPPALRLQEQPTSGKASVIGPHAP